MFPRFKLDYFLVVSSTIRKYSPRKINAGIDHQFNKLDVTENFQEDPEGFGDLESDFMNLNKSHKEHEREELKYREKLRYWTIKNKYFRIKYPNFLTYAEKEQIKLLNSRDPEEWTPEKLSESFPASPDIIAKVISAKWLPRSIQRVRIHDEGVMRNWNLLKEGKFPQLTADMRNHIEKFANRLKTDPNNFMLEESILKPPLPKPKLQEFSNIITKNNSMNVEERKLLAAEESSKFKWKKKQDIPNSSNRDIPQASAHDGNETYVIKKIIDKRQMRIQDLKELKLKKILPLSNENQSETSNQYPQLENPSGTGIIRKYDSHQVTIDWMDMKKYDVTPIKEKIYIPKKLWKKGSTYKVEDSYFDDDGEFLYRVPGMTGNSKT